MMKNTASYQLSFEKERFKFSASHFTLFSRTEAERLHGHNYHVLVEVQFSELDPQTGMALPFHLLKKDIESLCMKLDEYVLIPEKSPFLKISSQEKNIKVSFHTKKYSFPRSDVVLLPIVNITSELLASWFHNQLEKIWSKKQIKVLHIRVGIQESSGQTVYYD